MNEIPLSTYPLYPPAFDAPRRSEEDVIVYGDSLEEDGFLALAEICRSIPFEGPPAPLPFQGTIEAIRELERYEADLVEGPSLWLAAAKGIASILRDEDVSATWTL